VLAGIVLVCAVLKWLVYRRVPGRSYYALHPSQWVVIQEENPSYRVIVYDIFRGIVSEQTFEKYRDITPEEARLYDSPELRRHKYYSYISIAERNDSEVIFRDPVREQGLLTYPPWYTLVRFDAVTVGEPKRSLAG